MKYGLLPDAWSDAKDEIRHLMIGVATLQMTITYGELAAQLQTISPHPGAYVFHALLREICKEEREAHRRMLCAVVVSKATGMPGQGFFTMLIQHGFDCHNQSECWQSVLADLYDIWAS